MSRKGYSGVGYRFEFWGSVCVELVTVAVDDRLVLQVCLAFR